MGKSVNIDLLIKRGVITQDQVSRAKEEVNKTGLPIEKALERLGFISESDIIKTIADSINIPFIDLSDYLIDPEVIKLIPESTAKKFKAVPLFKIGDSLTVAMSDPQDVVALDEIRIKSGMSVIEPVMSTADMINKVIDQYYGAVGSAKELMEGMTVEKMESKAKSGKGLAEIAEEAPVIKLVNLIISGAVKDRASDIHLSLIHI